jgi:hypothetical protein
MGKDLRQRALHELKQLSLLFIYLSLLLGSFTVYRRLVLAEYHISYRHYGYALVEAIIIAKVILIGEFMKLWDRYQDRPLIVPTLYK